MAETGNDPCSGFSDSDFEKLRASVDLLDNRSFATKLTSAVGSVIERGITLLPSSIHDGLMKIVAGSLSTALSGALLTMDKDTEGDSWDWFHKAVVTATGAAGFTGEAKVVVDCVGAGGMEGSNAISNTPRDALSFCSSIPGFAAGASSGVAASCASGVIRIRGFIMDSGGSPKLDEITVGIACSPAISAVIESTERSAITS